MECVDLGQPTWETLVEPSIHQRCAGHIAGYTNNTPRVHVAFRREAVRVELLSYDDRRDGVITARCSVPGLYAWYDAAKQLNVLGLSTYGILALETLVGSRNVGRSLQASIEAPLERMLRLPDCYFAPTSLADIYRRVNNMLQLATGRSHGGYTRLDGLSLLPLSHYS